MSRRYHLLTVRHLLFASRALRNTGYTNTTAAALFACWTGLYSTHHGHMTRGSYRHDYRRVACLTLASWNKIRSVAWHWSRTAAISASRALVLPALAPRDSVHTSVSKTLYAASAISSRRSTRSTLSRYKLRLSCCVKPATCRRIFVAPRAPLLPFGSSQQTRRQHITRCCLWPHTARHLVSNLCRR